MAGDAAVLVTPFPNSPQVFAAEVIRLNGLPTQRIPGNKTDESEANPVKPLVTAAETQLTAVTPWSGETPDGLAKLLPGRDGRVLEVAVGGM